MRLLAREGGRRADGRRAHSAAATRPAISTRSSHIRTSICSTRSQRAQRFADEFPVVDKGLFFVGPPGIGKTHLAVAVLRRVIRTTWRTGLFYDTRELLKLIRSTYDPVVKTTESQVLTPVMKADLLVLDDLGAEKASEWVEETLNFIVNTRYNERRADHLYVELRGEGRPHGSRIAPGRVGFRMHSRLLRDVPLPRVRRRRLPTLPTKFRAKRVACALEEPEAAEQAPGQERRPRACPAPRATSRAGTEVVGREGGLADS